MIKLIDKQGFSLVEVIIALGIFSILAAGVFNVATNSYKNFYGTGDKQSLTEYAQEGIEAVRFIRDKSWQDIEDASGSNHGLVKIGDRWEFSGTSDSFGDLTRVIAISDAERDGDGNLVASGGTEDPNTKKAVVTVSGSGITDYVLTTYLTNWGYKKWTQTDWSGNGHRDFWSDSTMAGSDYNSTTTSTPSGQITAYYNDAMGQYDTNSYIYSSVYNLQTSYKELESIAVEQYLPPACSNCDVTITIEASNSSNMASAVSQDFSDTSTSYYVSSTPASLNGYKYIRYKLDMDVDTIYSPIVYSISIRYR